MNSVLYVLDRQQEEKEDVCIIWTEENEQRGVRRRGWVRCDAVYYFAHTLP